MAYIECNKKMQIPIARLKDDLFIRGLIGEMSFVLGFAVMINTKFFWWRGWEDGRAWAILLTNLYISQLHQPSKVVLKIITNLAGYLGCNCRKTKFS